jgi:hypothetical protein
LAVIATSMFMLVPVAIAQPVQANNCRYDKWGSSQWQGQKYKCPGGNSMFIRPPLGGSSSWNSTPNNSWETWKGTDNFGNRYNCTWDGIRQSWRCR